MGKHLVIYDITSDPLRTQVMETCKDAGLVRVQYSCYAGDLSRNRVDMLELDVADLLRRSDAAPTDAVYLLPLCDECFRRKRLVGFQWRFPDRKRDRYEVL